MSEYQAGVTAALCVMEEGVAATAEDITRTLRLYRPTAEELGVVATVGPELSDAFWLSVHALIDKRLRHEVAKVAALTSEARRDE